MYYLLLSLRERSSLLYLRGFSHCLGSANSVVTKADSNHAGCRVGHSVLEEPSQGEELDVHWSGLHTSGHQRTGTAFLFIRRLVVFFFFFLRNFASHFFSWIDGGYYELLCSAKTIPDSCREFTHCMTSLNSHSSPDCFFSS
jgi:hypothetical protein